jgi:hypothetical protein
VGGRTRARCRAGSASAAVSWLSACTVCALTTASQCGHAAAMPLGLHGAGDVAEHEYLAEHRQIDLAGKVDPVARTATDKGRGRITTRTIQVLPAPADLPFPHVIQVFLITILGLTS